MPIIGLLDDNDHQPPTPTDIRRVCVAFAHKSPLAGLVPTAVHLHPDQVTPFGNSVKVGQLSLPVIPATNRQPNEIYVVSEERNRA